MSTAPDATTALRLTFLGTDLDVEAAPGADIDGALRFLDTHVAVAPRALGAEPPLATLRISPAVDDRHTPPVGTHWEDIYLRKSASEFFTVPARRAEAAGREYVECTKTGTRFVFDRAARTVDVVVAAAGAMDLVELVRDLVLKDQENRGAAVLHATAAVRDGSAVLVTGAKGAGKSTILLELVEKFGYQVMSGDKTVVHEQSDGSVLAAGWPDYPHLGYGTLAKYPGLREIAGIEDGYEPASGHAFSPVGKFAVDPFGFRERFPSAPLGVSLPVSGVIHPSIGPGDRTAVAPFPPGHAPRTEALASNIESAFDGANAGWHHYLDDGRARHAERRARIAAELAKVPAWTLTGPGDLTPDNTPGLLAHGGGA
ncbi:hypothetical protein ACIQNI_28560 [Streptomyces sp. NPDC091266]|uniref:hypothetical protein n=1 Tax=Streptomyces sp. NPDC091266 TaxID=3365978 RepID=UPI00380CFD54